MDENKDMSGEIQPDLLEASCDWTFKQIFSDPDVLKDFLMSVLDWEYAPIASI